MRYVLAISGGVDSVVLLDMLMKGKLPGSFQPSDAVVAHFDHGIRAESGDDAAFVRGLAEKYGLKFRLGEGRLGAKASEELARTKRYQFLRKTVEELCYKGGPCSKYDVKIITAHHQDDLIETILINLIRGTGWRGLTPLWSGDIERPLLGYSKAELVAYAIKNDLEWVEDVTNYSPKYLRNRVRDLTARLSGQQRTKLVELYQKQAELRREIEQMLRKILEHKNPHYKDGPCNSNLSTIANDNHYHLMSGEEAEMTAEAGADGGVESGLGLELGSLEEAELLGWPAAVAVEVLNQATGGKLTIPQLKRLLNSLKTAKSGDILQPGGKIQVGIYQNTINFSNLD
jgi:tRNA(Ile)-lysidine synthetase-like protein